MVWVSTFSNPESLKTCTAFSWIPSMLKSADVQKPAKGGDNQGAIYLWARLVEDSASEPRAYRLPYSEKLHEKVISALNSSRRGTRQQGTVTRRSGSGLGEQRNVSIQFNAFRGRGLPPKRQH